MLKALGIPQDIVDSSTDQWTDVEQGEDDPTESEQQLQSVEYDLPALVEITNSRLSNFFEIAVRLDKCPVQIT